MPLRRLLMLFCAYIVFCITPAIASPSAAADEQFLLDKSTVVSSEPIWVTFRLVNHDAVPLHLFEAANRGGIQRCEYGFLARDAAGQVFHPAPDPIISGYTREVSVAPGATYQKRLFLPDWLGLLRPGRYTLRCWHGVSLGIAGWSNVDPSKGGPGAGAEDLPLTVLPPDKKALGQVIQALSKQTQSDNSSARDEAATSLAAITDPRIVPVLAALLARPDPPGRVGDTDYYQAEDSKFAAVLGLSSFPSDASAKALLAAMNGNNDHLRSAAAHALTEMKYAERVLSALRQELHSPLPSVRVTAIRAIAALQDPRGFDPLVNVFHDPSPPVRIEAAKELGTLRDRRAVPILKSHLKDPDLTLRLACIESLVPLKYPVLTQWLTPIVRSYAYPGKEHPSLEAMLALRQDCDYRAAAALASCLHFDDPRPSHTYNFFLIYEMDACFNGSKYYSKWINGGGDMPAALENNRKILAAIQRWMPPS